MCNFTFKYNRGDAVLSKQTLIKEMDRKKHNQFASISRKEIEETMEDVSYVFKKGWKKVVDES